MTAAVMVAVALAIWPDRCAVDRLSTLCRLAGGSAPGPRPVIAVGAVGVVGPAAVGLVVAVAVGPLQALASTVLSTVVWRLHTSATARRRRDRRLLAWEQALDRTVAAVRAGSPVGRALAAAAGSATARTAAGPMVMRSVRIRPGRAPDDEDSGAGSVRPILRAAQAAADLGGSASASLRGCGDPVAVELGAVWALAERHGVPLAGVLEDHRRELARRRELAGRIRAGLAGPRATAAILTALPGVGLLMGTGLGADPLGVLAGGGPGGLLCVAGAVFLASGLWWTERIAERAAR